MSNESQNVVTTQSNGSQGATSYGPRLRNKASPSKHGNQDVIRTIELQLDGSVQAEQVYDALNETQWALPKGCFVLDVFLYSATGMAALNLGLMDADGLGADTNVFSGGVAGDAWTASRDLDLNTSNTSQFVFNGIAASETATVYVTFLQVATSGGEDGVLVKPRVVPA